MKKFTIKIFFSLILCFVIHNCDARRKSGVVVPKCQLLSNGQIFWGPKTTKRECTLAPLCISGYKLAKNIIDNKRYCCCELIEITQCPNCEMAYAHKMPFWYWFNVQVKVNKGPKDGFCKPDRLKRILMEEGKVDKCCCEPRNSPFVPKEMKEIRKP